MNTNFEELMKQLCNDLSFSQYDVFVFINDTTSEDRQMYNFKMSNTGVFETELKKEMLIRLNDWKISPKNLKDKNLFMEDIKNGVLNLLTWEIDNVKLTSELIHHTGFLLTVMVSPILSERTTLIK